MRGIKIPQQDFALKMLGGGAYARGGGVFAGHYGICHAHPTGQHIIRPLQINL